MTPTHGLRAPARSAGALARPGHRGPALVVAVVSAVGVWLIWSLFVLEETGQRIDEAAFEGAQYGQSRLWTLAEPVLEIISIPFIALVLLAAMLLALLRGRWLLAVQVAVLMGGANLTTQLLKAALDRPDLGVSDTPGNGLPSGHTTAAASVAAALLLVVPRRVRPGAAVLAAVYTGATGISTLVGRWHRPSDVIAAVLVVLAWGALAVSVGAAPPAPGPDNPRETYAVAGVLVLGAVVSAAGALLALRQGLEAVGGGLDTRAELLTAYGGGALGVVAVVCMASAVLLLLRHAATPVLLPGPSGAVVVPRTEGPRPVG